MKYMPIVPVGMLDVIDVSGVKDVFILSQFWKNKEYRDFYKEGSWDTVIIDNDLYESEEAAKFEDMMRIAESLDAKRIFVVGPEDLHDGVNTGVMTKRILEDNKSQGKLDEGINLMCILHEKPNEMRLQYEIVKDFKDLAFGISIFSFRLGYDRASLYDYVGIPKDRYVHAFGWDNLLEVCNLKKCGFSSIDSSIAVTAAINKIDLTQDWQIVRQPGREGVLQSTRAHMLDDGFENCIKNDALRNILFLRRLANRGHSFPYNTRGTNF